MARESSRLFGERVFVDYRKGRSRYAKLGITCSKKFGKAHERNRFKRVVREAFRELFSTLPQDLELNISPRRPDPSLTKQIILVDLMNLIGKLQRWQPSTTT